ncbi:MAG TPA: hypothetical protein VKT73_13080 [Xanthobacteraceae bacterium]|nr:hypothetical protein [Xanthobacteraceae bacterium]
MGRPQYVPTEKDRRHVELELSLGGKEADICAILEIDEKTFRKHFAAEIAAGVEGASRRVAHALYENAVGRPAEYNAKGKLIREEIKPQLGAQKYWLACRAGWYEYAPPKLPNPNKAATPLGRKQQATADAMTAAKGTSWEDVLGKSPAPSRQ